MCQRKDWQQMEGCQISGSKPSMQALTIRLLFCKCKFFFFSAGCASVFLVKRSATLTHVVHCTCFSPLRQVPMSALLLTNSSHAVGICGLIMQNFQAQSDEMLISSNHAHSPVCGRGVVGKTASGSRIVHYCATFWTLPLKHQDV